jgi:hypothetical protein
MPTNRQQSWIKPIVAPPPPLPLTTYPSSVHSSGRQNSTIFNGPAITPLSK